MSILQAILARLKIENGAVRTAMSRLAADGWVVRGKSGRNAIYALAGSGRHAFDEATKRIYAAAPPEWDGMWTIALAPEDDVTTGCAKLLADCGFVTGGGSSWLRVETAGMPPVSEALDGLLIVSGTATCVPADAHQFWRLAETADTYRTFMRDYAPLAKALRGGTFEQPLDAITARTLLIHHWRRIVLHDPGLPAELLPDGWPGEEARALVRAIYSRLAALSERWLDEAGLPPIADPTRFAERFGIFQSSR